MDLRIFNDLPDTTTPLNADNLNYNFSTIDSEISNMHPVYEYTLTPISGEIASGSWQPITGVLTTDVIPKGKYLIEFSATVSANTTEVTIGTLNPYLDGARTSEDTRQSIPIGKALLTSGHTMIYKEFLEDSIHTIGIHGYFNYPVTTRNYQKVKFIRIG